MAKKTASQLTITSRAEAETALHQIGLMRHSADGLKARLNTRVAELTAEAAGDIALLEASAKTRMKALTKWAEANRDELLVGDARSVVLSSGTIGWRWSSPKVVIDDNMEEAILRAFRRKGLTQFIREKVEIAKTAVLEAGADAIKGIRGIHIAQKEVFFADPLEVPQPAPTATRQEAEVKDG